MKISYFVIDTFSDLPFHGASVAVVIPDEPLDEETKGKIAKEFEKIEVVFAEKDPANSDSERTSFKVQQYWLGEPNWMNGHSTQAVSYTAFSYLGVDTPKVYTEPAEGGEVETWFKDGCVEERYPAEPVHALPPLEAGKLIAELGEALGDEPAEVYVGTNTEHLLLVYDDPKTIAAQQPDFEKMKHLPYGVGVFVSAKAPEDDPADIVARAYWPKVDEPEDYACGTMHRHLAPFWGRRLGKDEVADHQLSPRGAWFLTRVEGDTVVHVGQSCCISKGTMEW